VPRDADVDLGLCVVATVRSCNVDTPATEIWLRLTLHATFASHNRVLSAMRSAVLTAALVVYGTVSLAAPDGRGRERPVTSVPTTWVESPRLSAFQAESSGVLAGTVTDARDGRSVPYATVLLLGTDVAEFADSGGGFRLTHLVPGSYTLRARQIGYFPKDTPAHPPSGRSKPTRLESDRQNMQGWIPDPRAAPMS
jgi:CarboxypepD_reg-like domain